MSLHRVDYTSEVKKTNSDFNDKLLLILILCLDLKYLFLLSIMIIRKRVCKTVHVCM